MELEKEVKTHKEIFNRLKKAEAIINDIWDVFYGHGLKIANWHQNGDLEPIETFFEENHWDLDSCAAERVADREAVWDIAHQVNLELDHTAALVEHEEYKASLQSEMDQARADAMARWEQTEAARKATTERLKLIGLDKLMMQTIADEFDKWVSSRVDPEFGTQEAMSAYCDLISRFKSAIHCFDQAGTDLA